VLVENAAGFTYDTEPKSIGQEHIARTGGHETDEVADPDDRD
jgi:hypothetical protein